MWEKSILTRFWTLALTLHRGFAGLCSLLKRPLILSLPFLKLQSQHLQKLFLKRKFSLRLALHTIPKISPQTLFRLLISGKSTLLTSGALTTVFPSKRRNLLSGFHTPDLSRKLPLAIAQLKSKLSYIIAGYKATKAYILRRGRELHRTNERTGLDARRRGVLIAQQTIIYYQLK